ILQEPVMAKGSAIEVDEGWANKLSGDLTTVLFSPEGNTLLVKGTPPRLWDIRGTVPRDLTLPRPLSVGRNWAAAFSPDGRLLALGASTGRRIQLWDLSGPQPRE